MRRTRDKGRPAGEASQEGQSRPVSLAGLVLVLCVALMGVMGVSITLPILPKLGAVFHQDAAGWRF